MYRSLIIGLVFIFCLVTAVGCGGATEPAKPSQTLGTGRRMQN
jgi:hypothetical protein